MMQFTTRISLLSPDGKARGQNRDSDPIYPPAIPTIDKRGMALLIVLLGALGIWFLPRGRAA